MFKQIIVKSCLTNVNSSNCQSDVSEILLNLVSSANDGGNSGAEYSRANTELADEECLVNNAEDSDFSAAVLLKPSTDSSPEQNALYYVAGYVCRKYLESHDCFMCIRLLVNEIDKYDGDLLKSYTFMKSYDQSRNSFGGLYLPAYKFLTYLSLCEDIFANSFMNVMHTDKVRLRIMNTITKIVDGTWFTENNACSGNLNVIVSKFVTLRIHNCIKFFNDTLIKQSSKKGNRKLLKIYHL